MRPRQLLFALIFLAAVLSPVLAQEMLEIRVSPVQNRIDWNGTALIDVTVVNHQAVADIIRLRPATFAWGDIRFDENVLAIAAGGSSTTRARVNPPRDVLIGNYAIEIVAISNSNPEIRTSNFMKVSVVSELPHVEPEWGIPREITPGSTAVNLILKNTGSTSVEGITAELQSELLPETLEFKLEKLGKGEAREVWDTTLDLPLSTEARNYGFALRILQDGDEISKYELPVTVREKPSIDLQQRAESGFLSTTYIATLTNIGNTVASDRYITEVPRWHRMFLRSEVKPITVLTDNIAQIAWPYNLAPGETTTIIFTISFVPLLALLLAVLVILYGLSWFYRREISINKTLTGGEKALKVKLTVKNSTHKPQRNIIVEDSIPTPLKIVKDEMLKPAAMKKAGGKMRVLWKFEQLWPGEEKTIVYHMRAGLPIVGSVILPEAKVRKKGSAGEQQKIFYSNRVTFRGHIKASEE